MTYNATLNRRNRLKSKYGITLEDYDQMFIKQDGRCKICGIHAEHTHRGLHIDHCHTTGKVRGLLCLTCNQGLGIFTEDISVMEKAIKHLINKGKANERM